MYGQILPYKQIQSFGLSNYNHGDDLANKNKFQTFEANGNFKFEGAFKINTEYVCDNSTLTIGSLGATASKWTGGVTYYNYIYGVPFSSSSILKINTDNDTVSTFGNLSGSSRFIGGVLYGHYIYFFPADSTFILKIDARTDEITTFGNFTGTTKWIGGCVSNNGYIYACPFNSSNILKIDPKTDTTVLIPKIGATYRSSCVYKNYIYFFPETSARVMRLNTNDDTLELVGTNIQTIYYGACLANNGFIYLAPFNANSVLRYDPNTFEQKYFGTVSGGGGRYVGIVNGADGNLYCAVQGIANTTLIVNTKNDTIIFNGFSGTTNGRFYGGNLGSSGKIYFIPFESSTVGIMNNKNQLDYNFVMNRHFNKL